MLSFCPQCSRNRPSKSHYPIPRPQRVGVLPSGFPSLGPSFAVPVGLGQHC